MNPYCAMFQAGAVTPSSALLLQDDTGLFVLPETEPVFEEPFEPPVKAGDMARPYEGMATDADVFVGLFVRYGLALIEPDPFDETDPIADGVTGLPCFLGPIVDVNLDGFAACAWREKAPIHCNTCAGSFASKRSTVKKRSCACMFKGGISHAFRKWLMFSI